jgi:hypothetical protein
MNADEEYLQQLEEQQETVATSSLFIRALHLHRRKIFFEGTLRAAKFSWAGSVFHIPAVGARSSAPSSSSSLPATHRRRGVDPIMGYAIANKHLATML